MSAANPAWMRLRSGRRLDLFNPRPDAWTDEDLASRLCRTYRWSSDTQWERPLSVAQHSLTVLHLREDAADKKLSPAERLRELLHDADEALLHFDAIAPVKHCLGAGYDELVGNLRRAIRVRYDLLPWTRDAYAAHKQAGRLAAATEARHVVGWSEAEIHSTLGLTAEPLVADPLPGQARLAPWEPWPARLSARLFLDTLMALQQEIVDLGADAPLVVLPPDNGDERSAAGRSLDPTIVLIEGGCETVEGQIVKGVRDANRDWDLDNVFTVPTDEGERVNGWACVTEIV